MSVTQASLLGDTFGSKASGTIPVGGIIMWSGSIASIPTGWSLCNGSNGTPNLLDRFIVGAGSGYSVAGTGGSADAIVVSHGHVSTTDPAPNHQHFVTAPGGGTRMENRPNLLNWAFGFSGFVGNDSRQDYTGSANETTANYGGSSPAGGHSHNVSVTPEGESGTNKNLPPYYALAFIMRVS